MATLCYHKVTYILDPVKLPRVTHVINMLL
jgi:hypothetical protein